MACIRFLTLFFRRSRPFEQVIPSLMFFVKESGVTRFHSFFQQLVRNFLFLLQFLILSLLAFSVMGFFADVSSLGGGRAVIVLDASLLEAVDVTAGLKKNGILIVNSNKKPEEFPLVVQL